MVTGYDIIVIGGSSGSIPILTDILTAIPEDFNIPIVTILHRVRNIESDLKVILSATREVCEPDDKEPIKQGSIYLAPQNYHLLIEADKTFCMDYSEPVNFSRPSIDVTLISVAAVYESKALGILLSGANNDGSKGIYEIISAGGRGIVQAPETAACRLMPEAAIQANRNAEILTPRDIIQLILNIPNCYGK